MQDQIANIVDKLRADELKTFARAIVRMFDEIAELRTADETVDAFMDLTGLSKTPLRAQAILGKWLILHHKEQTHLRERVEAGTAPGDPFDPAIAHVGGVFCAYAHPDDGAD